MPSDTPLPEEFEEELDQAVVDYLRAEAAGQAPDREELLNRYPHLRDGLCRFFADQDAVARVAAPLREVGSTSRFTVRARLAPGPFFHPFPLPAHFGAYELLEEIGHGGMGVVYRARHETLGRLVALKLIAPGACGDAESRARFLNEARAAARIQHPNVVQIFEVGEHQGQPYLALEHVAGGSLAEYLHGQPLPGAEAARLVEALARAIDAAHREGVIHRDLKPGNVLLPGWKREARSGQEDPIPALPLPKIADFGLARLLDADTGNQTVTGAILGTPSYMAPEQAAGRGGQAGPTADVYALGAMLYELLTGRPPFRGVTRLDTLHQVLHDEPVPPRRLQPGTARDLETICLKCLHKEPGRRYGNAHELAEELARFQAGKPILARPVGRIEIAWRWCRRQPLKASLVASLVLTVALGTGLVVWQWRRAENHLAQAKENWAQAERNRTRAEDNYRIALDNEGKADTSFRQAHEAVKELLSLAVQPGLLEAHGLEPLRRNLLRKAQSYYETFLKQRDQDPGLRHELADTSALLADVIRQIGKPARALAAYRRALDLYEELPHEGPSGVDLRVQEATIYNHCAGVLGPLGRPAEAREAVARAQQRLKEALRLRPGDRRVRSERAATFHNLGMIYESTHHIEEARKAFGRSRVIVERLLREVPDSADYQGKLANTLNSLGAALLRHDHGPEALDPLSKAAAMYERLVNRFPNNLTWKHSWATSLCNLADCLRGRGRLAESNAHLAKARPLLEEAVQISPRLTRIRHQLGLLYANLGMGQMAAGDLSAALESLDRARQIFQPLTDSYPGVVDYAARLDKVLAAIAEIQARQGKADQAEKTNEQRRDFLTRLVEAHPDRREYVSELAMTHHNLGVAQWKQGRLADARQSVQRATELHRKVLDAAPQDERCRGWLAGSYTVLVLVDGDLGHLDEADDVLGKRLDLGPGNPAELYDAARALIGASVRSKPPLRRRCLDLALRALQLAAKHGFHDPKRIRTDAALDSVRKDPDFQKVLTEMSK